MGLHADPAAAPDPGVPSPMFRAFWVDAFHPGICSPEEVDQLIRAVQSAHANAVMAQVRRRGDAFYNLSSEPRAALLADRPDFDPLAYLVERAHAADPRIEVHAWLTALPIATASAPPSAPEHVYCEHGPDAQGDEMWLSVDAEGLLALEDTLSVDPGHPGAAQHLVDVCLNVVASYDVDGIHLDRIRYAGASFGYNPVSVARYRTATGTTGVPPPTDPAWQQWRRDQVTHVMRQVYLEAIALKPGVKVSAATIPWGIGPASDDQWLRSSAMTGVYQDWLAWLGAGILDMAVPMNYDRESDARQRWWFDRWVEWEKEHSAGRHLVIGLGAYLNDIEETIAQARRALAPSSNEAAAQGVAFYSYALTNRGELPAEAFFQALAAGGPAGTAPLFASQAPMPEMAWKTQPVAGYVKGFVLMADGRPGDGLTVVLNGPSDYVLTASGTGFYGAAGLAPGTYDVTALREGRALAAAVIDVEAGRVATADLWV